MSNKKKKGTSKRLYVTAGLCEKICNEKKQIIELGSNGMHPLRTFQSREIAEKFQSSSSTVTIITDAWIQLNKIDDWDKVYEKYQVLRKASNKPKEIKPVAELNNKENGFKTIKTPDSDQFMMNSKWTSDTKYWENHSDNVGIIMSIKDWREIHQRIDTLLLERRDNLPKGVEDLLGNELRSMLIPFSIFDVQDGNFKAFYNLRYVMKDNAEPQLKTGQYYYVEHIIECDYEEYIPEFDYTQEEINLMNEMDEKTVKKMGKEKETTS